MHCQKRYEPNLIDIKMQSLHILLTNVHWRYVCQLFHYVNVIGRTNIERFLRQPSKAEAHEHLKTPVLSLHRGYLS